MPQMGKDRVCRWCASVLGKLQALVSSAFTPHRVQPRYCICYVTADMHGEDCSRMDSKESLLVDNKLRNPECWSVTSGKTLGQSQSFSLHRILPPRPMSSLDLTSAPK